MSENQNYLSLENVRLYYNAKRDTVELTAKSVDIDGGVVVTIPAKTKLESRIREAMKNKGIIAVNPPVDFFTTDAYVNYRNQPFNTLPRENEFFHHGNFGVLSIGVMPNGKVIDVDLFQGKNHNIAVSGDYPSATMLTWNIRQYLKDTQPKEPVYLYKFSQKELAPISSMETHIDSVLELLILLRKLSSYSFDDSQKFILLKNFDSLLNGDDYDSRTDKAARAEVLELIRKLSYDRSDQNPVHFVFVSNKPETSDLTINASSTFVHFGLSHERPSTIDYLSAAFGKKCIEKTFGPNVTGPAAWGIKGRGYAKATDINGKITEGVIQAFTAI
jgi:hypothetical protein